MNKIINKIKGILAVILLIALLTVPFLSAAFYDNELHYTFGILSFLENLNLIGVWITLGITFIFIVFSFIQKKILNSIHDNYPEEAMPRPPEHFYNFADYITLFVFSFFIIVNGFITLIKCQEDKIIYLSVLLFFALITILYYYLYTFYTKIKS